jgi:hypothetical protein
MSVEIWISAFSVSGGMPSGPVALFDLNVFMALLISCLVGGSVSISRSSDCGGIFVRVKGAGLLSCSFEMYSGLKYTYNSKEFLKRYVLMYNFIYFTDVSCTSDSDCSGIANSACMSSVCKCVFTYLRDSGTGQCQREWFTRPSGLHSP